MSRYLKIGLLIVAIAVCAWWFLIGSYGWKSLPGGSKVCVLGITHGTRHQFRASAHTFIRALTDSLRKVSLSPLNGAFRSYGGTTTQPEMRIYFGFQKADLSSVDNVRMILPDGQTFRSIGSGADASNPAVGQFKFGLIPTRFRKFKITAEPAPATLNHPVLEWEVDNPAFLANPPEWKAEPFPVTKSHGPVSVTIRGVSIDRSNHTVIDASVQWQGAAADNWFLLQRKFSDPTGCASGRCGLISEPVWKIDYDIIETATFPFPEAEVQWIGTTPAESDASKPGTFSTFPITPSLRASGVQAAAFLAPGVYDVFADGTVRLSESSTNAGRKGDPSSTQTFNDEKGTFGRVQIEEPSLLLMFDLPDSRLLHFRDSANTPTSTPNPWFTSWGGIAPRIYPLPEPSLRFGIAKRSVRKLEFFVKSPKPPPGQ